MQQAKETMQHFLDKIQIFSGAQLKYIAMLSMLIDHTNKAMLYPQIQGDFLMKLSDLCDILGRIAFPLFLFFLVEGFFQTKSRKKYFVSLLGFGVLAEVPFDLFTTASWYNMNWNNILFTFAMVLLTLWGIDALKGRLPRAAWYGASVLILLWMCYLSMISGVDYEYHAILAGYFFYIFRDKKILAILCSFASMYKEPWALLGFALILTYNGKRGRQHKLLNYSFYPAHMLVLGLLRLWLRI